MAGATAVLVFAQEHDLNLCWQSGWGGPAARHQTYRKEEEEGWDGVRHSAKSRKVGSYDSMGRLDLDMAEAKEMTERVDADVEGISGGDHVEEVEKVGRWDTRKANGKQREGFCAGESEAKADRQNGVFGSSVGSGFDGGGSTSGNGCAHIAEMEDPEMDAPSDDATLAKMAEAVKVLLAGLGEDLGRDGLIKTPLRMAKALRFATKGYRQSVRDAVGTALFALPGGSQGGTVLVRDVDTFSHCRACLLPFRCRCHIAYVPGEECVVGLSKLARLAEVYSRRLQTPAHLAQDIANGLETVLAARGVAVVVESWHIQSASGAEQTPATSTPSWVPSVAAAASGCFHVPEEGLWDEFVAMLGLDAAVESRLETPPEPIKDEASWLMTNSGSRPWVCPFGSFEKVGEVVSEATAAVSEVKGAVKGEESSAYGGGVLSEITELDEERPCVVHQDLKRGSREERRRESRVNCGAVGGGAVREAALPRMIAAMETLLQSAGGDASGEDPGMTPDEVRATSERYARWLLSATQGSQRTLEDVLLAGAPVSENGFCGGTETKGCSSGHTDGGRLGGEANGKGSGLVSELSVPLVSQCEHHLLPFLGTAHVGYVLGGKTERLARSQVERIVALYSQRLQVQERLTKQIAEAIASSTNAEGVIVVVEASHMCMMSRGIEKMASSTATTEVLGSFKIDPKARVAFLRKLPRRH